MIITRHWNSLIVKSKDKTSVICCGFSTLLERKKLMKGLVVDIPTVCILSELRFLQNLILDIDWIQSREGNNNQTASGIN